MRVVRIVGVMKLDRGIFFIAEKECIRNVSVLFDIEVLSDLHVSIVKSLAAYGALLGIGVGGITLVKQQFCLRLRFVDNGKELINTCLNVLIVGITVVLKNNVIVFICRELFV